MVNSTQVKSFNTDFDARLTEAKSVFAPAPTKARFHFLNSSGFLKSNYKQTWLVEKVVTAGQPLVVGGPKKALKTSMVVDLAVSLASGGRFLGKFSVPEPVRVGVMSGESGGATLQETLRRVCESKEVEDAGLLPIMWNTDVPSLSDPDDLAAIAAVIEQQELGVFIIDPLYLALLKGGSGLQASSLYDIGPLLANVAKTCLDAGATPVIVHHFRKGTGFGVRGGEFPPPELDELAFAGIAEFARQWILLGRRKKYDPETGTHELWMTTGGSAGHSNIWAVDVYEGMLRQDFTGRCWQVDVRTQSEQLKVTAREVESARHDRDLQEDGERAQRIRLALRDADEGMTINQLKTAANASQAKVKESIEALVKRGEIKPTKVKAGNGQEYPGYCFVFPRSDDDEDDLDHAQDQVDRALRDRGGLDDGDGKMQYSPGDADNTAGNDDDGRKDVAVGRAQDDGDGLGGNAVEAGGEEPATHTNDSHDE